MKYIILIIFIGITIFFIKCESNNVNVEPIETFVQGTWISEGHDTLNFVNDGIVIYKNYHYCYKFKNDSLIFSYCISSNSNNKDLTYKFDLNRDKKELLIDKFYSANNIKFIKK